MLSHERHDGLEAPAVRLEDPQTRGRVHGVKVGAVLELGTVSAIDVPERAEDRRRGASIMPAEERSRPLTPVGVRHRRRTRRPPAQTRP